MVRDNVVRNHGMVPVTKYGAKFETPELERASDYFSSVTRASACVRSNFRAGDVSYKVSIKTIRRKSVRTFNVV